MMDKPKKCCELGGYEHQIPMPLQGRIQHIDFCVAPYVAALEAANLRPAGSCCGHGTMPATIVMEDDTWLVALTREQAIETVGRYKQQETK